MHLLKTLGRSAMLLSVIFVICINRSLAAPPSQDIVLNITSPAEGSTLSGVVSIQGTATHPNFASYGVLYATGAHVTADTGWRLDAPIAWDVASMVVNGELGAWDTTQVPNGQYVLALVVYEVGNETPNVHFVNNLTVMNEEATPTPEPTPEPVSGEPGAEPTDALQPGPGEAPVAPTVEQPPTATPRLTPTIAPQATPTDEETESINPADILSGAAIKEAFITGAWLAVFLYLLGGLYVLTKAVVRYYFRQLRQQQRSAEGPGRE